MKRNKNTIVFLFVDHSQKCFFLLKVFQTVTASFAWYISVLHCTILPLLSRLLLLQILSSTCVCKLN